MLVLDETYTGALLRQAVEDDMVSHAIQEGALYRDPTTSNLLNKGINPLVRQDVLWDLLLFHPAICSPYDNFNVDKLLSEGLIEKQLSFLEHSKYTRELDDNPESILLFEKYILGGLREKGLRGISSKSIKDYINNSKKYDLAKLYSEGLLYWDYSSYEDLKESYVSGFSGTSLSLPSRQGNSVTSGENFAELMLSELTEEKFNFHKRMQSLVKQAKEIRNVAHTWFLMSGVAIENDAVLKVRTPSNKVTEHLGPTLKTNSATKSVIKIWLSEIETLPKLTTIEDVLRLREEKSITNFKDSIMEWADAISKGKKEEQRLRDYIKIANKELKKLSNVQKVAGWTSVMSLPIDIAILAAGLPIITSPIGLGFYAYERHKKSKYDWVMFGR